jgi:hypothetical protein
MERVWRPRTRGDEERSGGARRIADATGRWQWLDQSRFETLARNDERAVTGDACVDRDGGGRVSTHETQSYLAGRRDGIPWSVRPTIGRRMLLRDYPAGAAEISREGVELRQAVARRQHPSVVAAQNAFSDRPRSVPLSVARRAALTTNSIRLRNAASHADMAPRLDCGPFWISRLRRGSTRLRGSGRSSFVPGSANAARASKSPALNGRRVRRAGNRGCGGGQRRGLGRGRGVKRCQIECRTPWTAAAALARESERPAADGPCRTDVAGFTAAAAPGRAPFRAWRGCARRARSMELTVPTPAGCERSWLG